MCSSDLFSDSQWVSLLRSLDGLQLYRRVTRALVEGDRVVRFVLTERQFPRSVGACLGGIGELVGALPDLDGSDVVRRFTVTALDGLNAPVTTGWTAAALHEQADRIQLAVADLDRLVGSVYFRLQGAPATTGAGG